MSRRRSLYGAFFREDVAKRVVELLKLGRGWLDAAALAAYPHAAAVPQRLKSALPGNFDPVYPAFWILVAPPHWR